jgi:hypothetical protein
MDAFPNQTDTNQQSEKPHPRKQRQSNTGLYLLLVIALAAFAGYKMYTGGLLHTNVGKLTSQSISNMQFNGKITQFVFDGTRQNAKIAILTDGTRYAIYDQWVYAIDLGDSLVKEKGTLLVNVYKPKKDKVVLDYYPILRRMEIKGW